MSEKRTMGPIRAILTGAGRSLDAPSTAPPKFIGHRHDYNAIADAIREAQGEEVHAQCELAKAEQNFDDAQKALAEAREAVKALCLQFADAAKELAIRPEDLTS